ncbi:MAG: mechanosensitive ion channel [Gammaproteobacteria bacterium]|nr:MAG: mechanosensitive ion channel [Gammaproteobacteria bacterium]
MLSHIPIGFRFLAFTFLSLLLLAGAGARAQEAAVAEPAPVVEPPPEEKPTVDLTSRSQEALGTLDRLTGDLEAMGDSEQAEDALELLRGRVDDLLPEGQTIEDLAENPAAMDGVAVRSKAVTLQATALIDGLTDGAKQLEELQAETRALIAEWEKIRDESAEMPAALQERVAGILKSARDTERLLNEKLNKVIELQDSSMAVRNLITPIAQRIDSYGRSQQTQMFERNVDPVWSITTENITQSSERSTRRLAGGFLRDFNSWLETSEASIGGHLLLLPLLLILLFKLKSVAETPSSALNRPVPTGILIWMLIGVAVYAGSPQIVRLVFVMTAMLVATVVLLNFLPREMRRGVVAFAVVAIIHEVVQSQPVVEPLPRLAYLVIGTALLVIAWLGRGQSTKQAFIDWGAPKPLINAAANAASLALAVALIANAMGYVVLGKHLTTGVIDSVAVFLILFAGFSSISEIIQIVLGLPALDNFRSIAANRYRLQRVLRKPLVWLSLILWGWATLIAFGIDGWVIGSVQSVFRAEMTIGEVTLSLRGILVFVFAIWLAVWTSRLVRAVLDQDVLPRMDLPRGVPNTISMTAHYSIIMIGLLLGVGFMGLDLSNLAFIVGALGVGIGFGMQNVVNNFVSGLILIFEAPIQVGDTVEVGTLMGRVTQIGIRTSRVRTYSGSEVIVPNGDLVSNQVINWTLSDRRRRLQLAVGVAYGTDPTLVTEVLRGVLDADEEVLDDPEPLIVFNTFGDSSLNFNIYAWISDFDIGMSTTHRLNTSINAALADAGITIPFPQRDVHLIPTPESS